MVGLFLIALGTGGIKPCVAAFGGDQFQDHQVNSLPPPQTPGSTDTIYGGRPRTSYVLFPLCRRNREAPSSPCSTCVSTPGASCPPSSLLFSEVGQRGRSLSTCSGAGCQRRRQKRLWVGEVVKLTDRCVSLGRQVRSVGSTASRSVTRWPSASLPLSWWSLSVRSSLRSSYPLMFQSLP